MSLKLAASGDFYTQAFNFVSATQSGVDPRTGLYTLNCAIANLSPNDGLGPQLKLALNYSPLSTSTVGLGTGCTLGLSSYDTDHQLLTLASGEQYKIIESSSNVVVKQKKIDNFRFEKFPDHYKITHKSGQIEILTGPDVAWHTKVPVQIFAPGGHAVTLNWAYVGGQPRLLNIQDEQATVLVEVDYSAGTGQTTLTVWTGSAESRRIVLHFMNDRLNSLDQVAGDTTLTWQFKNEVVGDYTLITGLTSPSGLIEQVSYQKDGHAFPSSAGMKPLPYVTQLTQYPQKNQPKITLNYRYTTTNYLGGGNGQSWSNSEDYLYGVLSSYLYGSTEARQDGDVLIETTRTYNNYHLLTEEKVAQDGCIQTKTTDYYAVVGKVFDDQPNQFQFPNKVTVQYTSASGDTSEPEVTHTEFDDSGNITKKVEPDGMTTTWDYYPADGDGDNCPAEPNGFVRCVRTETVTPGTPVPASATYTAPVHKKQYTFEKLPAANIAGTPVPYVLSTATEKYLSDDVVNSSKQMTYINAPDSADHGRLSSQSVTLYVAAQVPQATQSFTRQHTFTYERAAGVLVTTTTITGHDNIATTSVSGRQRLTGLLTSTTDVLGNTTDYTYDGLGRMQSKTLSAKSAYEHTTTYSYTVDENGSTITTTDPSGNQIRTGYDALERIVQKEQWNNDDLRLQGAPFATESHQYDALGRKSQITLTDQLSAGVGDATTVVNGLLGYDSWGNPSTKTFNDGREENSHYDPVTRTLTNTASGEGNGNAVTLGSQVTTYSLSALPVSSTRYRADNTQESQNTQEYDGLRRLRKVTDAMGYVTLYEYDWCGRVVQTTLPDNTVIRKAYAPHSTRPLVSGLTVTDAKGVLIDMGSQTFDSLNRRTSTTSGGRVWQFTYRDASNKPAQTVTPNQDTLKYTYIPELGNALQTVNAPDIQKTFEYDKTTGQARTAQEANGRKNAWSYYPSGRLESETIDDDLTTHYSYSLLGLQQSYTDVMQGEQTTQYDGKGRRTGVTTPAISATLKYDDIGRMEIYTATDIASKATLTTKLTFDDFSREIRRDITDQKGQSVFSIAQTYYPNGQVKNRTTTREDKTLRDEKYTYNNRNQLIDYTCSGTEKPLDAYGKAITHQAFTYGVLGNITTMVTEFDGGKDTASYTYAANDPTQLSSVTHTHKDYPALQTLTYDNAGQLTDDGVGHTLSYDALGRVINIQGTKSQGCTYRYDASNTQVGQDISGGSQHDFYYAAGTRVNEIVKGKDEQQRRWLKLGATCLGQQTEGTGAQTLLAGTDTMNSVLAADSPDGTLHFSYSPYGVRTAPDDATVPVGFNGEAFDPIISGYFLGNGARLFIPSLGIFNKPDDLSPFGAGGINPYAYCLGDPINQADPTGHISIGKLFGLIFGAIAAFIAGVVTLGAAIPMIAAGAVTLAGGLAVAGGITGGVAAGLGIAGQLVTNKKVASALGWASLGVGLLSLPTGIGAAVAASRAAAAAAEGAEEVVGEAMEMTEISPVEEEGDVHATIQREMQAMRDADASSSISPEVQQQCDNGPEASRIAMRGVRDKWAVQYEEGGRQARSLIGTRTTQDINDAQASAENAGLSRQASLRSISSTNSEELRSTFEELLDSAVKNAKENHQTPGNFTNKSTWYMHAAARDNVSKEFSNLTQGFTDSTTRRLENLLFSSPEFGLYYQE